MLFESFKRMRLEQPASPAFLITSGDRSVPISWRQFTDDIDLVVRVIRMHVPHEKIGVIGENSYEWIVAHAAILLSGATVVPLDVNLNAREIAARMEFTGARVLVHSSLYGEKVKAVHALTPKLLTAGFGTLKTERFLDRARRLLGTPDSIWDEDSVDVKHTSMLVFTSGTTSEPRAAELTIEGIDTFISYTQRCAQVGPGQRSLMLLPLHHIFGICATYYMLAQGTALGICPDYRRIYDAAERFRVNYLFLVPALADILAKKIEHRGATAEEALGTPIDWVMTGGAPTPKRTVEHLTRLGIRSLTIAGMTETCAHFSVTPVDGDPHVGAQGKVPQDGVTEVKVSADGELLIRGPSVMKGYYKMPDKTAAVLESDGWYHTGDLGHIDGDGFVYFTGRRSRTIILDSGKKIAPEELEEIILSLKGIEECVVSGHEETREVIAEVYSELPESEVKDAIFNMNVQLPIYKRVRTIICRTEPFPRTSSGKIQLPVRS